MKTSITVGVIATRLGIPIHKIEYLIKSRKIMPIERAGNLRIFDEHIIDILRKELNNEK